MKKILIIIVTWNKKKYVIQLLESIYQVNFNEFKINILVIDNASIDNTAATLKKKFPEVRIIVNKKNLGGTGGFNRGISWALTQKEKSFDYLWLLDNDVVVHNQTLHYLVETLEKEKNAAICGSTIMQLDFPWRINEMGAFVDLAKGKLILHRYQEEISELKKMSVNQLAKYKLDLSTRLINCPEYMDVDYVAAASLLIKTSVARKAGLWDNYFIHFDDVEWCLRIKKLGYRILASSLSVVWHLSNHSKISTWILYYDNRNILYLLEKYSTLNAVKRKIKWIKIKAFYYSIIGKQDLALLHIQAIRDYRNHKKGKAKTRVAQNIAIADILTDPSIKTILVPSTIDLHKTNIHKPLALFSKSSSEIKIDYLCLPGTPSNSIPRSETIKASTWRVIRWIQYLYRYKKYDLVLQSDYQIIPALSWLGKKIIFTNNETATLHPRASLNNLFSIIRYTLRV
jgi:GT2 family glycosyltransferase